MISANGKNIFFIVIFNNMYVVNYIFYLRKKNRFAAIKIKVSVFMPLEYDFIGFKLFQCKSNVLNFNRFLSYYAD